MAEQVLKIRTTIDASGVTSLRTHLDALDKAAGQTGKQLGTALKPIEAKPNTAGLTKITTDLGHIDTKAKQTHTVLGTTLKATGGPADTKGLHTISTQLSATEKAAQTAHKVLLTPLKALGGPADTKGLKEIDSGLKNTEKQAEQSSSRIKSFLSSVASTAAGIAIADVGTKLAGGLVDAVKSANEFDDALLKTQALAGASKDEIDGYRKGILDLTTQIPVSANEMADALFFVKSAGFSGAEALNILKISGEASASGLGNMKVVADAVTSTLNAYKLSGQDAAHVTDVLTAAVTDGKASADSFAPALGRVLPLAAQMGVSFEQVTASMATMTRTGLNTDEAATALRGTLAAFEKPGKQAQAALASIGLTADEVRQSIREKGLLATLKDLNDRTEGNDETLAMIIPNIRALTGVLSTAGSQADAYTQILDDMNKAHGNTENAFKTMQESATFQWGLMRNNMQKILIEIGSKVLPILSKSLAGVTDAISQAFQGDWSGAGRTLITGLLTGLRAISDVAQQFGSWLATEFAAGFQWLGTRDWGQTGQVLVKWLGTAVRNITGLAQTFGNWLADELGAGFQWLGSRDWGQTAQVIGTAITTVLGSIGGVAQAFGNWLGDQVAKVNWDQVWSNIKTTGINLFGSGFGDVADTAESIVTTIRTKVLPAVQQFVDAVQVKVAPAVFDATKDVISWLGDHKEVVVGAAGGIAALAVAYGVYTVAVGIATGATTAFGTVLAVVTSPVTLIIAAFVAIGIGIAELIVHWKDITAAVPALGVAFDAVKQAIGQFSNWLAADFVPGIANTVAWIHDHWSEIVQHFSGPIEIIKSAIVGGFDFIKDQIHIALDLIVGIVKVATDLLTGNWSQAWNDIKALVVNIWNDIKTLISDQLSAIEGILDGAWQIIKDVAGAAWAGIKILASDVWSGIKSAITTEIHDAENDLGTIWDAIKNAATVVWDGIKTVAGDLWGQIKKSIVDPIGEAKGAIGTIWSDISKGVDDAWNAIKQKFIDGKQALIDVIEAPFKWVQDSIPSMFKGGLNTAIDVVNKFFSGVHDFVGKVVDAVNWVLGKLHLPTIDSGNIPSFQIERLAKGTSGWPGGMALVGEVGPELVYLPNGASVLPADKTRAVLKGQTITDMEGRQRTVTGQPKPGIDVPGFFLGLDPGNVIDAIRGAWSAVHDFVNEWVAKGAEALVNTAMDTVQTVLPSGDGVFGDLGKGIATTVKDGVVSGVKELLGLANQARPPEVTAAGNSAIAAEIVAWANGHAKSLGIDPKYLALALVASSAYETNLTDMLEADPSINPGGVQGVGPFQITPGSKATAAGFNPHSASSSLDYFVFSGDMASGVAALLTAQAAGMDPELAAHEWERVAGRPNATIDAQRIANGDWDRAYRLAQAIVVANAANPLGASGTWVRPLGGGYTITQGFGPADPSVTGMEPGGFHQGVDLASFRGDPVLAALAGVVNAAGNGAYGGLGIAVVVDNGQGINTIYGHLLDTAVSSGQVVNAGTVLGHEDSTGNSTGDHLHFQVNVNGTPVDPRQFVALAKGGTITNPVTALVGEEGPEIVTLPAGATVLPANITSWLRGGKRGFAAGTYPPPSPTPPGDPATVAAMMAQGWVWDGYNFYRPGPGFGGITYPPGVTPLSPSGASSPLFHAQATEGTPTYGQLPNGQVVPWYRNPASGSGQPTSGSGQPVNVNVSHVGGSPVSTTESMASAKIATPSWVIGGNTADTGDAAAISTYADGLPAASSTQKSPSYRLWELLWGRGKGQGIGYIRASTGFAAGGVIDEPILGVGLHTGRTFSLGEAGIEAVIPLSSRTGAQALATTLPSDIHAGEQKPAHTDVLSQFIVNDTVLAEMAYSGMNKDIRMRGRFP